MTQWHSSIVSCAADHWKFVALEWGLFCEDSWFQTRQEVLGAGVSQVALSTWHLAHHSRRMEELERSLDDQASWLGVKQPLQQESASHMEKCTYWMPGSYLDKRKCEL